MSVTTVEGIIENGRVRLPQGVVVRELQTVYVLVPDAKPALTQSVPGVRLANPKDAAKFEMQVVWENGR